MRLPNKISGILLAILVFATLIHVHRPCISLQQERESPMPVYIRETSSEVFVGNDFLEIGFRKDTGALWSFVHKESGIDLRGLKTDPGESLWDLRLVTDDMKHIGPSGIRRSYSYYQGYSISKSSAEVCLAFYWSKVWLEGYGEYPACVKVYVSVHEDSPFARLSIQIRNYGSASFEEVAFPVIIEVSQLGKESTDDFLVVPDENGRLFNNPLANLNWWGQTYPSGFLNMQFMAYYGKEAGFYIATYDSEGNEKFFYWCRQDLSRANIGIVHYPTIGFGQDFNLTYDIVLGVFDGDWHTAANLYKEWAGKQWWCAQKDTPAWLASIAVSKDVYLYGWKGDVNKTFAEGVSNVKEHQDYFKLPTLVLLWGWEKRGAWSAGEYFPPYEGWENFDKMIGEIHESNSRVWLFLSACSIITESEQWKNNTAKDYALVEEDGSYKITSGPDMAWEYVEMCPCTDYWRNTLKSYILILVEHGVDLIQFDGFPWCGPSRCYNASHNHPMGLRGNLWARAWIDILNDIKREARRLNPEIAFSGEGGAEIFIPFLDAYHSRDSWALEYGDNVIEGASVIPLFRYVYNDRLVMIGEHNLALAEFLGASSHNALGLARILTWGEIGSYNLPASIFDPIADKPLIDYMKRIGEARASYARIFLLSSTMIKPQEIFSPQISVVTEQHRVFNTMAVQYSAWKSADNRIGYILTNIWSQTCTINICLNLTEHGLIEPCFAYYVRNGEYYDLGFVSSLFNSTFSIDPLEILLIIFSHLGPSHSIPLNVIVHLSSNNVTQGELITVSAVVTCRPQGEVVPVRGANVTATIGGLGVLILLADQGNGKYEGTIDTSSVKVGTYDVVVIVQKEGYESAQASLSLTIKEKRIIETFFGITMLAIIIGMTVVAFIIFKSKKAKQQA